MTQILHCKKTMDAISVLKFITSDKDTGFFGHS